MSDNRMPYETAITKGHRLIQAFTQPITQSTWTDYTFLERCGWAIEYTDHGEPLPQETSKVKMYNDLGLSTNPRDNTKIAWKHMYDSQPYGPSTKNYPSTFAFYTCVYNPRAIIAHYSESPSWAGELQPTPVRGNDITPLAHWSDVVFLQWQHYCHASPSAMHKLKTIIQSDITNKTIIRIVNAALQSAGQELREWEDRPTTFPVDSKQGQAILATPNGVGPCWLLAQHKRQMGELMVTAVTCFWRRGWGINPAPLNLCFHVRGVK